MGKHFPAMSKVLGSIQQHTHKASQGIRISRWMVKKRRVCLLYSSRLSPQVILCTVQNWTDFSSGQSAHFELGMEPLSIGIRNTSHFFTKNTLPSTKEIQSLQTKAWGFLLSCWPASSQWPLTILSSHLDLFVLSQIPLPELRLWK